MSFLLSRNKPSDQAGTIHLASASVPECYAQSATGTPGIAKAFWGGMKNGLSASTFEQVDLGLQVGEPSELNIKLPFVGDDALADLLNALL